MKKKIKKGAWQYGGLVIERYEDGDLKGLWDIVIEQNPRCVTGPFKRLKHAIGWIDEEETKKLRRCAAFGASKTWNDRSGK